MTRFKSFCTIPVVAANRQVIAPTTVTTIPAVGANSNNGEQRVSKKTPEQTIVAAWINADTGVGNSLVEAAGLRGGSCDGTLFEAQAVPSAQPPHVSTISAQEP